MGVPRQTRKALSELTDPAAVTLALDEFDRLGRNAFLERYGFGPARSYFVIRDGVRYDSKAIAGAAYGYQYPDRGALRSAEFSGGEQHVMRRLTGLGFEVSRIDGPSVLPPDGHPREIHYWAFQANPGVYRIEEAVGDLEIDTWTTKGRDVAAGDRVLIWKAKGDDPVRGIVALGEVLTDPVPMTDDSRYWVDPAAGRTVEDRVRVRYVVPPGLPLWRGGPADELLGDLSVSRSTGGTVFRMTPEQWSAVVLAAGGWPEEASEVAAARAVIEDLARGQGRGQGFQVSPEARRAVEQHAMQRATEYWTVRGWQVEDVSARESYDLRCTRAGEKLRVEVKGTITDGSSVLLTPKEVEHARNQYPHVALTIVSHIEVTEEARPRPRAQGGNIRVYMPWALGEGRLKAVGYSYEPPVAE